MGSVSGLDADIKGAWSKRRYQAYQASVRYEDFVSLNDQIHDANSRVHVKDTIIGKLEERRDVLTATARHQEEVITTQKEALAAADAEISRLERELRAANQRADEADERAAACMRERDAAIAGMEAANAAAAEEAVKRGVAWDMGKQHALSLVMESVAMRKGNVAGAHAAAIGGGYLGGGFALAAATGEPAPGPVALRGDSALGRTGSRAGSVSGSIGVRNTGHKSGPGHPGMA